MFQYLDVLPIHPTPLVLESLTSYLIRLAEVNGFRSVGMLSAYCFQQKNRKVTHNLRDYTPSSFGGLHVSTNVSCDDLNRLTFYHLVRKFDRSLKSQAQSRFLSGYICPILRYCPLCLKEYNYYSLLWRFSALLGCTEHSVFLLDKCGFCNSKISIFGPDLRIGFCPSNLCNKDLRYCKTNKLSTKEKQMAISQTIDIHFFLTPQIFEVESNSVIKKVGQWFACLRKSYWQTMDEVANNIGIKLSEVKSIELGNYLSNRASFNSYIKYASYMGITLSNIFAEVTQVVENGDCFQQKLIEMRETALHRKVAVAQAKLISKDREPTLEVIGKLAGMSPQGLRKYPLIKIQLKEISNNNRLKRLEQMKEKELNLIVKTLQAIEELKLQGLSITQRAISRKLNIPLSTLRDYGEVKKLLLDLSNQ